MSNWAIFWFCAPPIILVISGIVFYFKANIKKLPPQQG